MRTLFVTYDGFRGNSAQHVVALAERLQAGGDRCVVAVPGPLAEIAESGAGRFTPAVHADLARVERLFAGAPPEVIVAWTPRENVRRVVAPLARRCGCPYVVHLEDNEEAVTASYLGVPIERLQRLGWWGLRGMRGLPLSHPRRLRQFLAGSAGVSILMDTLASFVPDGLPSAGFWPGCDDAFFARADPAGVAARRASLGVPPDCALLVYTGNIHRGNVADMQALYGAVARLNREGRAVRLLRTGENHAPDRFVAGDAAPDVVELGFRPRAELPGLLALADVLVQPGAPGAFNDFRFPSKLPEFLASGRPVVMTRTNLGRFLRDGEEALVVPNGSAEELAAAVARLLDDPPLAARLGEAGRRFARARLNWDAAAATLRALLVRVAT